MTKRSSHGVLILFAVLFTYSTVLDAQQISYILPDIGTPGMNTYVEIIGPHDLEGNFGPDGVSMNHVGDILRVECVDPADSNNVIIGPLVVSWNGRMISTQIFVNPDLEPNSDNWQALTGDFIIPIQVRYNGVTMNTATFYVVRPQPAIFTSADGTLGGGGVWGVRSQRGAMIVDSLELLGDTYDFSTADCDPTIPGNQGFLPVTILSKGPLRTGANTTLLLDASGKQGGPGGAGGGGHFCDASGSGADGGDGFTGGGRGGRNRSGNPFSSDEFRNPGIGSGSFVNVTGGSLNGLPGGNALAYEASGGGTGHPFGISGEGCHDGAQCNPPGGYGGGSGQQQRQSGGAGGYATQGESSRNANGGSVHGNDFLVPMAGGSGGASGNPQVAFACSGDGGGGGGAVRLYAPHMEVQLVTANGAGGSDGSSGDGGSGSGGGVILESKLPSSVWKVRAEGGFGAGPEGGAGRIRLDGPIMWTSSAIPAEESMEAGPSTDTTMFVRREFTITGTGNGSDIRLFLKSDRMPWTEITTLSGYDPLNPWSFDIMLPAVDNVYYLVALQEVSSPGGGDTFTARPHYVMSQSAANILISRTVPEIFAESSRQVRGIVCEDVMLDTMFVENIGDGLLIIEDMYFEPAGEGFELVEPSGFPVSVDPGQSLRLITRFMRQPGQRDQISADLLIESNSPGASPLTVAYGITVDVAEMQTSLARLDFPAVVICEGASSSADFSLSNTGTIPLLMDVPSIDNPAFELISPSPGVWPLILQPGATMPITLRVTHSTPGTLNGTLRFSADENGCNASTEIELSAASNDVSLFVSDLLPFDTLLCSDTWSETVVVVRNDGDISFIVDEITSSDAAFSVLSPLPPFPLDIGEEQLVRIRFTPDAPGDYTATLRVSIDRCGLSEERVLVAVRESVGLFAEPVDFGLQRGGNLPVTRITTLTNTGSVAVTVDDVGDLSPFRISAGLPVRLLPGETADLTVVFDDPGNDGEYTRMLPVNHLPSCEDVFLDVHGIRGTASLDLIVGTLEAEPGQIVELPVFLRNARNSRMFGATEIRATLRYRASLLVPLEEPRGTLSAGERSIDITIPLETDAEEVALRIPMMVTLGVDEETELLLDDVISIGGDLTVNVEMGHFS
ncbi:MAG: hypothetical protein KFH87_11235, partial [Bacteroidetes bacterium]|nr:hypothetical protein [Bacteroidota bacterium]